MSTVNYEDIYEEFLLLSSSSSEQPSSSSTVQNSNSVSKDKISSDCESPTSPLSLIKEASATNNLINSENPDILPGAIPPIKKFKDINMGGEEVSVAINVSTTTNPKTTSTAQVDEVTTDHGRKTMSSPHGPPPSKRLSVGDGQISSIGIVGGTSGDSGQNGQGSNLGQGVRATFQPLSQRGTNGSNSGNECQQINRQPHTLSYHPFNQDFQYPSPHFLTGGCIQQASQPPAHMHSHTGWIQQGQSLPHHAQTSSDHNYNVNLVHNNQSSMTSSSNNSGVQPLTHHNLQQPNQLLSPPQYAMNSNSNSSSVPFNPTSYPNMSSQNCQSNHQSSLSNSNQVSSTMSPRTPWGVNNDSLYPGGLDILWREVPEECQKLMTLQDVPDTARMRGYFTVSELLTLKRNLQPRLTMSNNMKSGSGSAGLQDLPSNTGIVGMVVKEAMNTLDDYSDGSNIVKTENDNGNEHHQGLKSNQGGSISDSSSCASSTVTTVGLGPHSGGSTIGPPPPYRTATLVFKLLQIGNYQFRSFSEINPNRLRVLFNTQRLTYECQLSVVRPPRDGMQPLRKLLTVDIGFDQISMIRFGTDKLFLRVEGAPLLTVTYNPANDDSTCPTLSQQDQLLLEQIDKGQLKLSPCHQLYFLNERLVHLLEAQFREHPRFRHILQDSYHQQHQQHSSLAAS